MSANETIQPEETLNKSIGSAELAECPGCIRARKVKMRFSPCYKMRRRNRLSDCVSGFIIPLPLWGEG